MRIAIRPENPSHFGPPDLLSALCAADLRVWDRGTATQGACGLPRHVRQQSYAVYPLSASGITLTRSAYVCNIRMPVDTSRRDLAVDRRYRRSPPLDGRERKRAISLAPSPRRSELMVGVEREPTRSAGTETCARAPGDASRLLALAKAAMSLRARDRGPRSGTRPIA